MYGNWDGWVKFFLRGVREQAGDASTRATQLQDLQLMWREKLSRAGESVNVLRLADKLFETPIVTVATAERLLGVTNKAARANVNKLLAHGMLTQESEVAYRKSFAAQDIVDILSAGTNAGTLVAQIDTFLA